MIKSVMAYVSPSKPVKTSSIPISRKVAVTGAGGYIGSHVVDALLRDPDGRFEVVGTVRSLKDDIKIEHLYALPNAKQKLTLVEADLLNPESLEAAFEGCDFVLHVASPFIMTMMKAVKNAEEVPIGPIFRANKKKAVVAYIPCYVAERFYKLKRMVVIL
jgi:FlaA1/EpsC-like NDP-sugar epimerase